MGVPHSSAATFRGRDGEVNAAEARKRADQILANNDEERQHSQRDDLYIDFIARIAGDDEFGEMAEVANILLEVTNCAAWFA